MEFITAEKAKKISDGPFVITDKIKLEMERQISDAAANGSKSVILKGNDLFAVSAYTNSSVYLKKPHFAVLNFLREHGFSACYVPFGKVQIPVGQALSVQDYNIEVSWS